ncbi:hypothetical protein C8Q80DRAFT_797400 [Daedaleopsis nitida]|nr:hypothetical protein C8Q80DRAFT_797400 [Daedaleopsis nitida]
MGHYTSVIFILNTLHLIFSITSIFQAGDGATSNLSVFIDPLTTILIYRFILDLQAANAHNVRIGSQGSVLPTPTQTQSTLGFVNRTVGSLASTIISGAVSAHTEDGLDESYDDSPGHTMQLLTPDYSADAAALEPMPYVREDL